MLTIKQAVRNIHNVSKESTSRHWIGGSVWYNEAYNYCLGLSLEFQVPLPNVVGCLAILSPNCSWSVNKQATRSLLATGTCPGANVYPHNVAKARRVVFDNVNPIEAMHHRRYGSKVRAFYDNILNYETSQAVTVDTHAIRAAFNLADLSEKQIRWVFDSKAGNKTVADAYRIVARKYNIQPHQLQATVWLTVKTSLEA